MSNNVHPRVPTVHLRQDNSVDVVVEVVDIDPGDWAEISGYILQGDSVYSPFSATKQVPSTQSGVIPTVTVNVLDLPLNPKADVKVIARVTKAQIWPTTLGTATSPAGPGIKVTWTAKPPTAGVYSGIASAGVVSPTPGQRSYTITDTDGKKITIIID